VNILNTMKTASAFSPFIRASFSRKQGYPMINLRANTTIYRPIKQVFDFISTPENDSQWQYGILASGRLSGENAVMGSFFRSIGHLMGHRSLSTFEVTEYESGRRYGFKSLSGPLNSHSSYTFEMSSGGTKVNISTQVQALHLSRFNENILEKTARKQLKENLALLKKVLETRQISLPAGERRSGGQSALQVKQKGVSGRKRHG
jgi:uncharacterized membrane protein